MQAILDYKNMLEVCIDCLRDSKCHAEELLQSDYDKLVNARTYLQISFKVLFLFAILDKLDASLKSYFLGHCMLQGVKVEQFLLR